MTLEEYSLISACNGVFSEAFRPDTDEASTDNQLKLSLEAIEENKSYISETVNLSNSRIISHSKQKNCKNHSDLVIKKANIQLFEAALIACCRRDNFNMILNHSRTSLDQTGDGHFSPIVSYNYQNRFLLTLDVARFKYNSFWVSIEKIYESFFPKDKIINKPRGFMITSRYFEYVLLS